MVIWPTWWIFFFLNHASYHFLPKNTPSFTSFRSHQFFEMTIHLPWYLFFFTQPSVFFISTNWPTTPSVNFSKASGKCAESKDSLYWAPTVRCFLRWKMTKKGLEGGNGDSKVQFCMNKYRKTWEFIRNYPKLDVFFQMRFDNSGSYVFIHVQQQGPWVFYTPKNNFQTSWTNGTSKSVINLNLTFKHTEDQVLRSSSPPNRNRSAEIQRLLCPKKQMVSFTVFIERDLLSK